VPRIHQEVVFAAPPARIYRALIDSAEHTKLTGAPAEISAEAGGAFSAYGGRVVGRQIELVPDSLIVQAWRPADWPAGVYTLARFELRAEGAQTRLVFDQDAVPENAVEHLEGGWKTRYWDPLRAYLER
jgi:activator of HSP90 ATPase